MKKRSLPKSSRAAPSRASSSRASSSPREGRSPRQGARASEESLRRAFDALRSSPFYEMIKRLNAGELVAKNDDGSKSTRTTSLSSFTLEDLLTLGPAEVCKLSGVTIELQLLLADRIQGVSLVTPGTHFDAPGLMPEVSPTQELMPPHSKKLPPESTPTHRTTEAELEFLGLLQQLRGSSRAALVSNRKLEDFWQPEWPAAPFEQQLTIRQLLDTDIEAILKKRSFTAPKLAALSSILRRLLSEAGSVPTETASMTTSALAMPTASVGSAPVKKPHSLDLTLSSLSPLERTALWGFEEFVLSLPPGHPFQGLFSPLNNFGSPAEIASWLTSAVPTLSAAASKQLMARISSEIPHLMAGWEAALAGAGARVSQLLEMLPVRASDPSFEVVLLCVLLSARGARPVEFRGAVLQDYWTLNPETFKALMEQLLSELPLSDAKLHSRACQIFPLYEPKAVLELINKYAN